jgi:hypothetical protein
MKTSKITSFSNLKFKIKNFSPWNFPLKLKFQVFIKEPAKNRRFFAQFFDLLK